MPAPSSTYVSNVWKDGIFDGRVAFVTGGAGTICSVQTRALVRLGANACIVGRNADKTEAMARDLETARAGSKVIGIGGCDVRKIEDLQAAAKRCIDELGAIDFVIAGAAGNFVVPISGMSSNAFKSVMDIDVLGTFNTIKATMPHLVESAKRNPNPNPNGTGTGGRFLAVSATFHYTGMPLQAHVAAAKAGVDSLVASVALEYGPLGITANAIAPGPIAGTEGMERLAGDVATGDQGKGVPSGRWGTVRDIADATVYLFSDAGNYVNGQIIPVDGASWRRQGSDGAGVGVDSSMKYPDYIIKGEISKQIKTGRKETKL
ncbi:Peroxisomal 2,4-dienoyl-CoA reductase SPS19 [Ceratocystis lukuohia]|uniref:2,4-dienoyl-CoA reductase [(3E)-enoyl-CoA-producing] n=3 Tax=Ceratocystis TaxID=5157 RepID=A0A0F8B5N5_CERFI|nr:Peroxisomal 2 4-dienoyl-CoA reductase SPS19 [Ceratocystis platani]PHH54014.1 Peroxisomal 2,4-dienoyl-CoA reductase SPS19 [Ceratocystis fimbriata CBS 114723]